MNLWPYDDVQVLGVDSYRHTRGELRKRRSMRHMVRNTQPMLQDEEPKLTSVCSWRNVFWRGRIVPTWQVASKVAKSRRREDNEPRVRG